MSHSKENRRLLPAPYDEIPASTSSFSPRILSKKSISVAMAAIFSYYSPAVSLSNKLVYLLPENLAVRLNAPLAHTISALTGLTFGYGLFKVFNWAHSTALHSLLAYRGWVYNPKTNKTKMWAFLLKLLKGPRPFSMMQFQNFLPKQPLPDLDKTLDRWLEICKFLMSDEEYQESYEAIEHFRQNEGPKLQAYLEKRQQSSVSWLAEYWLYAAYLSSREPLAIYSNFGMCNKMPEGVVTDPCLRAAVIVDKCLKFERCLTERRFPPYELNDLVPLCMSGYKFNFSSARLPGAHMDSLVNHKDSKHIIVNRKGIFYHLPVYKKIGKKEETLSVDEFRILLDFIYQDSKAAHEVPAIAALTTQNRSVWYEHRNQLNVKNKELLHLIESALFILVLDDTKLEDRNQFCKYTMTGSGDSIWFDKCFNITVFDEPSMVGINIEHSVIDAMVFTSVGEYLFYNERYDVIPPKPDPTKFKLENPKRLNWNLDSAMESKISTALSSYKQSIDNFDVIHYSSSYGKGFIKTKKMSPDGYIQMSMQLAYWRIHKEIPKTYEPSTNRLFQLGRTETVHPGSKYSIQWMKCMDDLEVSSEEKLSLLRRAIKHQTQFRLDATVGEACDRHLLGLLCAARENGMDVPRIFTDKAWRSGYKLSTSQCPTKVYEYGANIDPKGCLGCFAATDADGYSVCYTLMGEDLVNFVITSFHSSPDTSSSKMAAEIDKALSDLKNFAS